MSTWPYKLPRFLATVVAVAVLVILAGVTVCAQTDGNQEKQTQPRKQTLEQTVADLIEKLNDEQWAGNSASRPYPF